MISEINALIYVQKMVPMLIPSYGPSYGSNG